MLFFVFLLNAVGRGRDVTILTGFRKSAVFQILTGFRKTQDQLELSRRTPVMSCRELLTW